MTWTWPELGIGWLVALVCLIAALLLGFMGLLSKEAMLVICAISAMRL